MGRKQERTLNCLASRKIVSTLIVMMIRRNGLKVAAKRVKKNEVVLHAACFTLSLEELEQFFRCLLGVKGPHGYSGKISRYLDVAKKRFSGMKSHDCHVLMTQILPVAIRGIMDAHVRETLTLKEQT